MDVPAPLVRGAALLRCPVCSAPLRVHERSLVCDHRHTYDIARHGHVTLARAPAAGDDAPMVAARAAVFDAGHYAPLTAALARAAEQMAAAGEGDGAAAHGESAAPHGGGAAAHGEGATARGEGAAAGTAAGAAPGRVVLDIGAGTGHHLAGVLRALPGALGFALDTSRPALRLAARAHPDVAAVVGDVWEALPLQDGAVDLALVVFAPRNGAEIARVLTPGGAALVVIPTPEHLGELAHLHGVQVDPEKPERLERTLGAHLVHEATAPVRWTMALSAEDVEHVIRMSPAGAHRREGEARAATVTGSVELRTYRSPDVRGGG